MIQPVASHQSRPGLKTRRRRPGTTEHPLSERQPAAPATPEQPGINPTVTVSKPLPGRLRLVGEGDEPARKIWRLKTMDTTTNAALRPAGLAGALRLWSAARALLALFGLAVILAVALPAPREALMHQYAVWTEAWED